MMPVVESQRYERPHTLLRAPLDEHLDDVAPAAQIVMDLQRGDILAIAFPPPSVMHLR